MAENKTIDQLTEVTTLADTKNLIVGSNSTANRITWANIKTLLATLLQPLSAGLTSLAGLATAADKMIFSTAENVWAEADITAFGRSLIDDANAADGLATLGGASSADLTALEGTVVALGTAADENVGTGIGNVVQLEDIGGGTPGLPAVDGSQLTGVSGSGDGGLPPGHLTGYTLSNSGNDDITTTAGAARDSTSTVDLVGGAMTKQLDAAWAAGTDAGGRMSAAAIADTTYHFFAIQKDSDESIDYGFDVSPTAPTMPAGYTYFRRLGCILRESSAIVPFTQLHDYFRRTIPAYQTNAHADANAVTYTLATPIGLQLIAQIRAAAGFSNSAHGGIVSDLDTADTAPSTSGTPGCNMGSTGAVWVPISIRTSTAAQIRARFTEAATMKMVTDGWFDARERYD
jgi:hypothetical protein